MHPAASVILFTTASGAGYGLLFLVALGRLLGLPMESLYGALATLLALVLITIGLLASTFHLGHPERAWRALSQWRSSWLSREGVLAVATYVPVLAFAFGWVVLERTEGIWAVFGVLGAVGAAATVYCTAMIYRSLAAIPQWHQPLVPLAYIVLALTSGAVWLNAILALFGLLSVPLAVFSVAACIVSWRVKQHYWLQIDTATPESTAETATGLGRIGPVRLLEPPHTEPNYLQREMGYRIARKHARQLRMIAIRGGFALPAILVALQLVLPGSWGAVAALLAAPFASAGIVVERWLFFAEAEHKTMLYYGATAV